MKRATRHLAAALAVASVATLLPAAAAPAAAPPQDQRPRANVDARRDDPLVSRSARRSRAALERSLGAQGVVATDRTTGSARIVARRDGFLTAAARGDAAAIALGYVRARPAVFGLDGDDLAALRLTSRYRSPDGVTHLAWVQTARGVAAYDNVLFANVARDGRIVNAGGSAVGDLAVASTAPAIGAGRAIARARLTIFSDGRSDRLAWRVEVGGPDDIRYEAVIDAHSEKLLLRRRACRCTSGRDRRRTPAMPPTSSSTSTRTA